MVRCVRCVMDTTVEDVVFDEEGVCNYCKNFELRIKNESITNKEEALLNLVKKIKEDGKSKEYDCVIGVSGGVDSSYVAHLVKDLKLRPIAIHLDNGWNSELAVSNIEKLLTKLDIDLVTHVIDWNEFKDLQKSFIRSSIKNLEIPTDHAIGAIMFKIANKYGIKYIINGSNLVTEGILPVEGFGRNIDYKLLKSVHKKFGSVKLKTYPSMSLKKWAYNIFVKKIKYIPLLNYVDYVKEDAIVLLEEKYGWKRYGGKHYESIFTRFYQGYILPKKYGFDKRIAHLSTMIMSKQISREDAIKELNENPYGNNQDLLEEDKAFLLKKLDFSKEEFERILKEPSKRPEDYPSSDWMFKKFGKLMKMIKEKAVRGA